MANKFSKKLISIMVWPEQSQVEIFTKRGESFIVRGDEAIEFAFWLRDNLVEPLLDGKRVVE